MLTDKFSKECNAVKVFKRSKGNVCPYCSGFGNSIELLRLTVSLTVKSETPEGTTALGLFI